MARSMDIDVGGVKNLKNGTNIKSVNVPDYLRVRIPTTIPWIDYALGGEGFTPSTSAMLTGGSGFGKTTLVLQLADALTGEGHIVLFNTGEECLYQTALVVERLKLKNGFVCGQHIMMKDIIAHADFLRKKNPGKHVFLFQDSLQAADDGHYRNGTTGNTPVRCAEIFTSWAKDTGGIVVFIGQVNKDGEFNGKNAIRHAVDVHLHFTFDTDKKSDTYGERLLENRKNRFGRGGTTVIVGLEAEGLYEKGRMDFVTV